MYIKSDHQYINMTAHPLLLISTLLGSYLCCTAGLAARVKCELTAFPPDPSSECCGYDASGDASRIVGGNVTAIDEYPWLAIIEYAMKTKIVSACGGVLISGRYVVTAGHCVLGPDFINVPPVSVRLGEYDTSNSGPDCVEVPGGGLDCNDGAQSIAIQKITPHPDYDPSSVLKRHDIALVRLAEAVNFTYFVRPICLPTADFTSAPAADLTLYVAGWGAVGHGQKSSDIKLKVDVPYLPYQECQLRFSQPGRRLPLWEGQICAGGEYGKDSCRGDSGGPLMKRNERIFEVIGIVSFGLLHCGTGNIPGVYTKVYHYLPWITSQITA